MSIVESSDVELILHKISFCSGKKVYMQMITGTTPNCIADVSVTILTFWDGLGTDKDLSWEQVQ